MEEIRTKSRGVQQDCRRHHRSNVLNSKRLHLNEVIEYEENNRLGEEEVKSLAQAIKSTKDEMVLKKLKWAFSQGESLHQIFLKNNGSLHGLIGLFTCREIHLQMEAAACIINILAAGDHHVTHSVAKLSAPYFILYLQSSSTNLQELSAWALGNIAADCSVCCDLLKAQKFSQSILGLLGLARSSEVIHSALFALKCYMKHHKYEWNEILLLGLEKQLPIFLKSNEDESILIETATITFYLTTSSENDRYLLESGCVHLCLQRLNKIILKSTRDRKILLTKSQCQVATFLIRSIAGVSENPEIANAVIAAVDLTSLSLMLTCNYLHLHKEIIWLLSNLGSHTITIATICPWHCIDLLTAVAERLLGTEETVEQVLTFFCNVLTVHGWRSTLPSVATFVNEDTIVRLLCSSNHKIVHLTLKLLTIIYNDQTIFTTDIYSEKVTDVIHGLCFLNENISNTALSLINLINIVKNH